MAVHELLLCVGELRDLQLLVEVANLLQCLLHGVAETLRKRRTSVSGVLSHCWLWQYGRGSLGTKLTVGNGCTRQERCKGVHGTAVVPHLWMDCSDAMPSWPRACNVARVAVATKQGSQASEQKLQISQCTQRNEGVNRPRI